MSDSTVRFVIDGKSVLPEKRCPRSIAPRRQGDRLGDGLICCTATPLSPPPEPEGRLDVPEERSPDQVAQALVSIRWNQEPTCEDGKGGELHIGALVAVETPDEATNLFDIVPPTFILDPALLERGRALFNQLPRHFKRLFNAVFRERMRFPVVRRRTGVVAWPLRADERQPAGAASKLPKAPCASPPGIVRSSPR